MCSLYQLPEEVLLQIVLLLEIEDILSLSHACSSFNTFLGSEILWKKLLVREHLQVSNHVRKLALNLAENLSLSPSKAQYLSIKKLHQKWNTGEFTQQGLTTTYERTKNHMSKSDNYLAFVDIPSMTFLILLTCPGINPFLS